jgi:hypothetical protein
MSYIHSAPGTHGVVALEYSVTRLIMPTLKGLVTGFGMGFFALTLWFHLTDAPPDARILSSNAAERNERPPCTVPPDAAAEATTGRSIATALPVMQSSASLPPPPPAPGPAATKLTEPRSSVAMCVGGLLSLDIYMQGRSVRLGILDVLRPDVFVAGTLNGTRAETTGGGGDNWKSRVSRGLQGIEELAPFAAVEVQSQPSPEELRAMLQQSGHFAALSKQASGAGAGRLRQNDEDPRLWLPTMLSPAVGNPQANTLREFHYQSRCMDMIERVEARRARAYERVLFTRLENHWLAPHPPLALLSPAHVWVPAGEDNGGVNDRHWLSPRREAGKLMRRWDALLDGTALTALHGTTAEAGVRPRFLSSEMYLREYSVYHRISFARFPMLAYLACCEDIYRDAQGRLIGSDQSASAVLSTGEDHTRGARTCYQPHCNRKRCPRSPPLQHRGLSSQATCETEDARSGFKYDAEGSAAIINAELLATPGAALAVGAGPPGRVEIALPIGSGGRQGRFYFCFGCDESRRLTADTNLTAGCLFSEHRYEAEHLTRAVRERHACRYFDHELMRQLCHSFSRPGDKPDHRGDTYGEQYFPWWCKGLAAGVSAR